MKLLYPVVAVLVLPVLVASGTCGGDDSPDYVSPFCLSHPGMRCMVDADCSDTLYCDGAERCMPGTAGADGCGCVGAPAPPCSAGQTCNEDMDRCYTASVDADADGHLSMASGGDDCDDNDPNRFPGNAESCDAAGHDEDCDANTFGVRDMDHDQFDDALCCNTDNGGTRHCGSDCDDTNAAIVPGAQKCFKDASTNVLICQPDGTWSAQTPCAGAETCTAQPNGLGVCHL